MTDLRGKAAVVTGGAGGIGQAMGRRFGREGMKVVLADVLAEPLDEATRALADEGIEAVGVVTDVTDYSSVEALAKEALDRFGAVYVVCNNAGTGGVSEGYMWKRPGRLALGDRRQRAWRHSWHQGSPIYWSTPARARGFHPPRPGRRAPATAVDTNRSSALTESLYTWR